MKMCVARCLEGGVIRCGFPEKEWRGEEDMYSVDRVKENAKLGYCNHCGSLKRAIERKIVSYERKLE